MERAAEVIVAGGGGGALNTFQRLMKSWTTLGPYNAVQVMTVAGDGDAARWDAAALETVRELGLGRPIFERKGSAVRYGRVPWQGVEQAEGNLETYLNAAVNRGFADEELPLRFFLSRREQGGHRFGAVYDHWIADSRAMRDLMRRVYVRYSGKGGAGLPRLTVDAPSMRKSYGRKLGLWPSWTAVSVGARTIVRHSQCHRINLADPVNVSSRLLLRQLSPGLIGRIYAFAKARGVTVNDVFLGVIGQVMGEHTAPHRYQARKRAWPLPRNRVALGTIMDIREAANLQLDDVFGLYLSTYATVLQRPEEMPFAQLVQRIGDETREVKQNGAVLRGFSGLTIARLNWELVSNRRYQSQTIHRVAPAVAGVSNVNMTGSWVDRDRSGDADREGQVLDYLRTGPAGPLVPLVFTLTTIGSRLHLCMTYRTTAFDAAQAQQIIDAFIRQLEQIRTDAST